MVSHSSQYSLKVFQIILLHLMKKYTKQIKQVDQAFQLVDQQVNETLLQYKTMVNSKDQYTKIWQYYWTKYTKQIKQFDQ